MTLFQTVAVLVLFVGIFTGSVNSLRACFSIHDSEGRCVTFEMCPPFLEMLKEGKLTSDKLRLLQRLTCGFDNDMPMICCPIKEILIPNTDVENHFQAKHKPVQNVQSVQSTSKQSSQLETTEKPYPTYEVPIKVSQKTISSTETIAELSKYQSYAKHPNFHLIPSLKDCSNSIRSDRIVGGKDAEAFSYPWMARIGYLNLLTNEVEFYCAGTIINKRYILTAAHCTEEIDEDYRPAVIRVGEHDTTKEEDCSPLIGCIKAVDYVIEKVIPHPGYQKDDKANDIELIRVTKDISFETFSVRPICLPFIQDYKIQGAWEHVFAPKKSLKGWVTGWGRTKWNNAEGSDILQEVQLPIVSNEYCQSNYSRRVQISEKQMCAGGIRPMPGVKTMDSCGGDSGGPLMVPLSINGDGKFFQIGVVSFGPVQCGINGLPGVYSRISKYLDWILDNMKR